MSVAGVPGWTSLSTLRAMIEGSRRKAERCEREGELEAGAAERICAALATAITECERAPARGLYRPARERAPGESIEVPSLEHLLPTEEQRAAEQEAVMDRASGTG